MFEIDITHITNGTNPADYSCSTAERGAYAGSGSWNAATTDAMRLLPASLCSRNPYKPGKEAMTEDDFDYSLCEWILTLGAWDADEIREMGANGRRGLLLQFISGDIREAGIVPGMSAGAWFEVQTRSENGQISGRIGPGDDGRIWFTLD